MRNYNISQVSRVTSQVIFRLWICSLLLTLVAQLAVAQIPLVEYSVPDRAAKVLQRHCTIVPEPIAECSGMVQSMRYPGCYWVHNDSGDQPRIFLIDSMGRMALPEAKKEGINITNTSSIDWEEIGYIGKDLIIGDFGNNRNVRKDLTMYRIVEPEGSVPAVSICKYDFVYPDQDFDLGGKKNYDCEAMFAVDSQLYLITKHRSDSYCTLYRFGQLVCDSMHIPTPYLRANLLNMVTAADYHTDSKSLAVLTYTGVWLFRNFLGDLFFNGEAKWLPISARQCEAICFKNANTLFISNEQRDIFEISIDELMVVNRR